MRVRSKETGKVYNAVRWYPGVDHPAIVSENPPTRGERSGSAVVRMISGSGSRTVRPGEYILTEEDMCAMSVGIALDSEIGERYETISDDVPLLCPIRGETCRREGCAWWARGEDGCAVASISRALFTPGAGDVG